MRDKKQKIVSKILQSKQNEFKKSKSHHNKERKKQYGADTIWFGRVVIIIINDNKEKSRQNKQLFRIKIYNNLLINVNQVHVAIGTVRHF